jgi:hypothetical protein
MTPAKKLACTLRYEQKRAVFTTTGLRDYAPTCKYFDSETIEIKLFYPPPPSAVKIVLEENKKKDILFSF